MKLVDRERVEATNITIGRRIYYKNKRRKLGRSYAAEYRDPTGTQICESLDTASRAEARRKAVEIFNRLEDGRQKVVDTKLRLETLLDDYFAVVKAKSVAPKTEWKYRADLDKLKEFCRLQRIVLANRFSQEAFYNYRQWLEERRYADKTIYGALILAKQVFKWAFQEGRPKA